MIAATALGLLPGMSILGRLAFGALALRFETRYLATCALALQAVGVVILMYAKTLPLVYLYAATFGIGYGGLIIALPAFIGAYYGRTHYAQIMGWILPFTTLIGAGGPVVAGAIFEATGAYQLAFMVLIVFLVVGGVCSFSARPPRLPVDAQVS